MLKVLNLGNKHLFSIHNIEIYKLLTKTNRYFWFVLDVFHRV